MVRTLPTDACLPRPPHPHSRPCRKRACAPRPSFGVRQSNAQARSAFLSPSWSPAWMPAAPLLVTEVSRPRALSWLQQAGRGCLCRAWPRSLRRWYPAIGTMAPDPRVPPRLPCPRRTTASAVSSGTSVAAPGLQAWPATTRAPYSLGGGKSPSPPLQRPLSSLETRAPPPVALRKRAAREFGLGELTPVSVPRGAGIPIAWGDAVHVYTARYEKKGQQGM